MKRLWIAFACCVWLMCIGFGQSIQLDRGKRAAGLWCFPLVDRQHEWIYLPQKAHLATDAEGKPEFSFIRYVKGSKDKPATDPSANTITEADGGGVLHMLVLYDTDPKAVKKAESELQDITQDNDLKLTGPVIFSRGTYAVISSLLKNPDKPDSDAVVKHILDTGAAPVLEGDRVALSFDLDKTQASLLMQSFKMRVPDVSISFDMEFSGLSDPYDATIEVNWSEVQKDEKFSAGAKVLWFGADVGIAVADLKKNGAIKVTSRGENGTMDGMLNTAYSKIVDLLFQPVIQQAAPKAEGGNFLDTLMSSLGLGASGGSGGFGLSLYGSYQMKDLKTSGHTTISLNHQSGVQRHTLLTANIGELFSKYGNDSRYFRAVNIMADPVYQKRKVYVTLDGTVLPEFGKFVNSVTIALRKTHQDGNVTLGEKVIDKAGAAEAVTDAAAGNLGFEYGYSGDDDRDLWLKYEYRTRWNFQGGATYETPWTATEGPMINVFPPYEHRTVQILGDQKALKEKKIVYAVVRVSYPFFGSPKTKQVNCRVGTEPIDTTLDVTLPINQFTVGLNITWHTEDGKDITISRDDSSGIVLLDEVPAGANQPNGG